MKQVKLNQSDFIKLVSKLDGMNVEVTISSKTLVSMNKNVIIDGVKQPNPFYDQVYKFNTQKVVLGFDYYKDLETLTGESVERKPNFIGEHISQSILQNRNDDTKFYLYYRMIEDSESESIYTVNDEVVKTSFLAPYFKAFRQDDSLVKVRALTLTNLIYVRIGRTMYIIDNTVERPTIIESIVKVKRTRKSYNRNYVMTETHRNKIRKGLLVYWTLKKSGVLVGV